MKGSTSQNDSAKSKPLQPGDAPVHPDPAFGATTNTQPSPTQPVSDEVGSLTGEPTQRGEAPPLEGFGEAGSSKNWPAAIIFDLGGVLIDWNPSYVFDKMFDNE